MRKQSKVDSHMPGILLTENSYDYSVVVLKDAENKSRNNIKKSDGCLHKQIIHVQTRCKGSVFQ